MAFVPMLSVQGRDGGPETTDHRAQNPNTLRKMLSVDITVPTATMPDTEFRPHPFTVPPAFDEIWAFGCETMALNFDDVSAWDGSAGDAELARTGGRNRLRVRGRSGRTTAGAIEKGPTNVPPALAYHPPRPIFVTAETMATCRRSYTAASWGATSGAATSFRLSLWAGWSIALNLMERRG